MSSSSMCQTVYDTVHTVIYDTVHTVSFDTIRTFDTVKVMLDSVFTIDLLNKSQEFYSSSFNWLLGVTTIVITAVLAFVGVKIIKDVSANKKAVQKAIDDALNKFNSSFANKTDEQQRRLNEMDSMVLKLRETGIVNWITQSKLAEDQGNVIHAFMCSDYALLDVTKFFDKTFITYGMNAIERMMRLAKSVEEEPHRYEIVKSIVDKIQNFENSLDHIEFSSDEEMAKKEKDFVDSAHHLCFVSSEKFRDLFRQYGKDRKSYKG